MNYIPFCASWEMFFPSSNFFSFLSFLCISFSREDYIPLTFFVVLNFLLVQHIEDLTQEKFSLQKAVEASRALAESLAAENSSLTDSYNKQVSL